MSVRMKRGRQTRHTRVVIKALKGIALALMMLSIAALIASCGKSAETKETPNKSEASGPAQTESVEEYDIAVFIPGVLAGSPLYQMVADGVSAAADEHGGATVKVVEGGFNQAEWQDKVTELAAEGKYELIVSSNPALPEICSRVSTSFPDQKFLLLDGFLEGNPSIYTFRYNQFEQGFLAGHMAGLVTTSSMEGANDELRIGLIAGQEYPDMNDAISPGFLAGAKRVNEEISLDFRVVGNWYDATKAQELSNSMIKAGVDVILPIAGGANQGVIKAAQESGIYLHWFDMNGYEKAPGQVIGSTALLQKKAAYEKSKMAIEGELPFGKAEIVGIADGWINFIENDPLYIESVPKELRKRQAELVSLLRSGELELGIPEALK